MSHNWLFFHPPFYLEIFKLNRKVAQIKNTVTLFPLIYQLVTSYEKPCTLSPLLSLSWIMRMTPNFKNSNWNKSVNGFAMKNLRRGCLSVPLTLFLKSCLLFLCGLTEHEYSWGRMEKLIWNTVLLEHSIFVSEMSSHCFIMYLNYQPNIRADFYKMSNAINWKISSNIKECNRI